MKWHLSNVEPSETLIENVSLYQKVEKIAASHIFEDLLSFRVEMKRKLNQPFISGPYSVRKRSDQIEVVTVLETIMEPDNPLCSTWGGHK